jgi:hypothetical protein
MDLTKVSHSRLIDILFTDGILFPVIYPVDFKRAGHIVDDVSDRAVVLVH